MDVKDAFEDIVSRGVGELRKSAFGDDIEDAKNLPWSREQAWAILKKLSKEQEVIFDKKHRNNMLHLFRYLTRKPCSIFLSKEMKVLYVVWSIQS